MCAALMQNDDIIYFFGCDTFGKHMEFGAGRKEEKSSCGSGWGGGKTLRLGADGAGAVGEIVVSAKNHAPLKVVQKNIG